MIPNRIYSSIWVRQIHLAILLVLDISSVKSSVRIKVPGTLCGIPPDQHICDALPVGIDGQSYDNGQGRSPNTCDKTSINSFCPYGMVTYGFGRNQYGQLGLGDTVDRNIPTALATAYAKIEKLECSAESSYLVWAGLNSLYSWGRSDRGQLGKVILISFRDIKYSSLTICSVRALRAMIIFQMKSLVLAIRFF